MHPIQAIKKFFATGYGGGMSGWINSWRNPGQDRNFLKKYNGYVYACVSAIAEDVAMIDFEVYRKLQDGSLQDVPNHPLLKILDNPNPLMSKYQLIEMTQTHIELTGEAFWYSEIGEVTGKPKSFYLLPPDRMSVAVDTTAELPTIAGYVFEKENGTKVPLDPNEVTHFKTPNPWNQFRGYGTVEAAMLYIQTEKFGSEFTRNYIYNNAMPAGIVSVKGSIDKPAFDEVKRQWKQEYGTLDKAGKTAFVKGLDIEFTKVGTTLGDAALKEIKDMSRDDIMTMFRVSKPILGIFEDVNLASAKTAQYVFTSRVIDPKMMRMVDTLQFVLNRWNTSNLEYVMGYESPVPEDTDEKIKLYEAGLNNWLTVNEIRKEEGYDPVDGGDQIRQALNIVPIGGSPAPASTGKGIGHGKITIRRTIRRTVAKTQDLQYQAKENFRQELMGNQEAYAKRFNTEVDKLLDAQLKAILKNLEVHGEKAIKTKAYDEFTPDADQANAEFVKHLTPIEYELMKEQGAIALALAGASELEFQLNEAVRKDVAERITRMATGFNDDTRDALIKSITEGMANNESFAQLKKRIETVYTQAKGYRAERIARTETLNASNAAAQEGYAQTGYITKVEWFTNPGACEFCRAMDGKVVGIKENFINLGDSVEGKEGGTYSVDYAAVNYPPLHPNCTCTLLPVRE